MPLSRDNFDSNSIYRLVNNAYTTSDGIKTSIQRQIDGLAGNSDSFIAIKTLINSQTASSYTLTLSDAGKLIEMNSPSPNSIIIPSNSTTPFPIGTKIDILQTGVGATSVSTISTVTLNSESNKRTINAQWQAVTLIKRESNTWTMIGAVKA